MCGPRRRLSDRTRKLTRSKFYERFAIDDEIGGSGAFVLTATGCASRFNIPREEMFNSPIEDLVSTPSAFRYAYSDIIRDVHDKCWCWAPKREVKRMIRSLKIDGKKRFK